MLDMFVGIRTRRYVKSNGLPSSISLSMLGLVACSEGKLSELQKSIILKEVFKGILLI